MEWARLGMEIPGEFFAFLSSAVKLVKGDRLLLPLLVCGWERNTIVNTVDKGWDKILLQIIDKRSRMGFFIVTGLSDSAVKSDEIILRWAGALFHCLKPMMSGETFIGIPE